jgi:hypothetical protein
MAAGVRCEHGFDQLRISRDAQSLEFVQGGCQGYARAFAQLAARVQLGEEPILVGLAQTVHEQCRLPELAHEAADFDSTNQARSSASSRWRWASVKGAGWSPMSGVGLGDQGAALLVRTMCHATAKIASSASAAAATGHAR